ncbi:hypothetical protein BVRB_030120, partial [Beta vulgaris subsp. vulgaris]
VSKRWLNASLNRIEGSVIDRAAQIRAKLAAPVAANKIRYDFGPSSTKQQAGDFYTKEEVASFKKPTLRKSKKTNVARRKIIPEELDLPPGPSSDHGSRDSSRIAVAKSDAKSHTLLDHSFVFEDDAEDVQLQEALARANRAARYAQEMQQKNGAKPAPKKSQPTAKISALPTEELATAVLLPFAFVDIERRESEQIVFSTASEF